jgi:NADH:ubiquinone oxidoreductase subunit F (NADH-binding)
MKSLKERTYKKLFQKDLLYEDSGFYKAGISVPHIWVERSTCSIVAGIDETIIYLKRYFQESGGDYVLIETACKGLCSFDPVVNIQVPGRALLSFKNVYYNQIASILDSILNNMLPDRNLIIGQYSHLELNSWPDVIEVSQHKFFKNQTRSLLKNSGFIQPLSIESYLEYNGYSAFAGIITTKTRAEACELIVKSGLRGRGGGGYYTGKKWKTALEHNSDKKYFICNADESDPGSFAGRMLIESNPHLLIEGVLIGAYSISASDAIIYIRSSYTLAIERLEKALEQATEAGLVGEDVFGSGINIRISIFKGAGAYVCGEETALISCLEGNRGTPRPKPPYPCESGLFGFPTIVNNLETICNVPIIIRDGVERFKQLGRENSYGTKLYSVSGKVDYAGIVEVEIGKSVTEILAITRNDDNPYPVKAVHIGGPSGGFVKPDDFGICLDYSTLNNTNFLFGSGSFLVLDSANCIVDVTKYYINFINKESCGKCIPCREGSQRLLEILTRITEKPKSGHKFETLLRFKGVIQMEEISAVMKETSLCRLGQNAPNTVLSGIKAFRQEYEEHIYEKKCASFVCRNLKEYSVNTDTCVGCGICAKRCPADAIIGSSRSVHFIVQDRCIKCGNCEIACKFDAINVT